MKYRIIETKTFDTIEGKPMAKLTYEVQSKLLWIWGWDYEKSFDSLQEARDYVDIMVEIGGHKCRQVK